MIGWTGHLAFLSRCGLLDWSQFYDLLKRISPDYNPQQDPIHIVSRTKVLKNVAHSAPLARTSPKRAVKETNAIIVRPRSLSFAYASRTISF